MSILLFAETYNNLYAQIGYAKPSINLAAAYLASSLPLPTSGIVTQANLTSAQLQSMSSFFASQTSQIRIVQDSLAQYPASILTYTDALSRVSGVYTSLPTPKSKVMKWE